MFVKRLLVRVYSRSNHRLLRLNSSTSTQHQTEPEVQHKNLQPYKLDPFSSISENKTDHMVYLDNLRPPMKKSFNLAAYVNHSETLQKLVRLGVSLYDIESTNTKAAQYYLTLDFDKHCANHIKFLLENGLKQKNLGRFISEFPLVFQEHIDDLQTRINYFESKGFSKKQISSILNRSALILSLKTKTIDHKLGELQLEFKLLSNVIRTTVALHPSIILVPSGQYKLINFTLSQEFGFKTREISHIIESQPCVVDILRPILVKRLDLIHNTIGLSHYLITRFPKLITEPLLDIKHRHMYLEKLKRNQYDDTKPLYVPPSALYYESDELFCRKYAKTDLDDYKLFLRSL